MKKVISLICLFSIVSLATINAQNWLQIGTEWHFNSWAIDDNGDEFVSSRKYEVAKDTIKNNQACKLIPPNTFMYEENEVVYLYNAATGEFQVYYDINSTEGDTWSIQRADLPLESLEVTVVEQLTLSINNVSLKALSVNISYGSSTNFNDTIIERIGYTEMFVPIMPSILNGNFRGLRCFNDSEIGFVDFNTDSANCDITMIDTSIPEIEKSNYNIYPNPTIDKVYISQKENKTETIEILVYDIYGKMVLSKNSNSQLVELNIENLNKGIYYFTVNNKSLHSPIFKN